jgi:hypothetical protein
MKAYSEDLPRTLMDALGRGMPKAEAARNFGIGIRPSSPSPTQKAPTSSG